MNRMFATSLLWIVGLCSPALASTIAVVTEAEHGPVPDSTFESVLWHALFEDIGHDATFLPALDASAVQAMRGTSMTTLLHAKLTWKPDSVQVKMPDRPAYFVAGHYPSIETTEYLLKGDQLVAHRTWRTEGPVSVFRINDDQDRHYIGLPEVSLQETTTHAIRPVEAPVWTAEPDWVNIPIVVSADEEYRSFYGEENWKVPASRAVSRANAILRRAGLRLQVIAHDEWTSPDHIEDLSGLLNVQALMPNPHPSALRIGFTGQTRLAVAWQAEMEDVGRAYVPGRDVIIADQAVAPGHDPAWDVADEGVAVAHEVLHALGIPHLEHPDLLMSATKRGTVHAMAASTIDLARTAAGARYTHWDTLAALASLSHAAETHLSDLELKLDYISDNLAYGPGVPEPGALEPKQLSALTNVAVARYYLKRARENPTQAWQLQIGARVHTESALAQEPSWGELRSLQRQIRAAQQEQRERTAQPIDPRPEPDEPLDDAPTCPLDTPLPTCE